jgi:hypothetical protein
LSPITVDDENFHSDQNRGGIRDLIGAAQYISSNTISSTVSDDILNQDNALRELPDLPTERTIKTHKTEAAANNSN